jgi:outer membrane protein
VNFLLRYEHDVLDNIGGGSATARISKGFQAGRFRFAPQMQVNWLSADLTNHDFGVAAEEAAFMRPAYDTGSSVSYEAGISSFIELTEDWRIFLSISAEFLADEIADSPIVADNQVLKGFAAITYVF